MASKHNQWMVFLRLESSQFDPSKPDSIEADSPEKAHAAWEKYRPPDGYRVVQALLLPPGAKKDDPGVVDLLKATAAS